MSFDLKIEYTSKRRDWARFYRADGSCIYEGHPEDFFYEFEHHANAQGICAVVEEVRE